MADSFLIALKSSLRVPVLKRYKASPPGPASSCFSIQVHSSSLSIIWQSPGATLSQPHSAHGVMNSGNVYSTTSLRTLRVPGFKEHSSLLNFGVFNGSLGSSRPGYGTWCVYVRAWVSAVHTCVRSCVQVHASVYLSACGGFPQCGKTC